MGRPCKEVYPSQQPYGKNTLYCLAENDLVSSLAKLEAVLVLIEYDIDVNYENFDDETVTHEFISPRAKAQKFNLLIFSPSFPSLIRIHVLRSISRMEAGDK